MVRKAKYARRQSASVPPKYDLTERLSDEIVLHIFGYLSAADLNTCARVTLRWFWLANDSHARITFTMLALWKKLYLSRFQTPLTVQETISRPSRAYERIDTGMDVQERPQKRRKVVDANEAAASYLLPTDIRRSNSDADPIVPMRLRSLPSEPGRRWKTWYKISHRWQTGKCDLLRLEASGFSTQLQRPKVGDDPPLVGNHVQQTPVAPYLTRHSQQPPSRSKDTFHGPKLMKAKGPWVFIASRSSCRQSKAREVEVWFGQDNAQYFRVMTLNVAGKTAKKDIPYVTCIDIDESSVMEIESQKRTFGGSSAASTSHIRVAFGLSDDAVSVWGIDAISDGSYRSQEIWRWKKGLLAPERTADFETVPRVSHSTGIVSLCISGLFCLVLNSKHILSLLYLNPDSLRNSPRPDQKRNSPKVPRIIGQMESSICNDPIRVEICPQTALGVTDHGETATHKARIICTVPVYGGGWSVGVQQFYFTRRHIGVTQYTILSNQANHSPPFHPISRRRRTSPLISYAPITALAYSSPYITTAHTDNTVQIYRIIDDHSPYDDERRHHRLRIVHERTLSGVASRVGSLAIDSRSGRVVSGDRWGIKVWEINEDADDVIPNDTQVLEDYSFWDDEHSILDTERNDRLDHRITLDNHISTIKRKKERGIFLVDLHDAMLDPVTGYNSGSGSGGMQGGITSVSFDDNRIIGVVSGPTEDKGVDWWSEVKVWKFASD